MVNFVRKRHIDKHYLLRSGFSLIQTHGISGHLMCDKPFNDQLDEVKRKHDLRGREKYPELPMPNPYRSGINVT